MDSSLYKLENTIVKISYAHLSFNLPALAIKVQTGVAFLFKIKP